MTPRACRRRRSARSLHATRGRRSAPTCTPPVDSVPPQLALRRGTRVLHAARGIRAARVLRTAHDLHPACPSGRSGLRVSTTIGSHQPARNACQIPSRGVLALFIQDPSSGALLKDSTWPAKTASFREVVLYELGLLSFVANPKAQKPTTMASHKPHAKQEEPPPSSEPVLAAISDLGRASTASCSIAWTKASTL